MFLSQNKKKTKPIASGGLGGLMHKKLFGSSDRNKNSSSSRKALTDLKQQPNNNARTLGMVLKSERELLSQNKDQEAEIIQLKSILNDKNTEEWAHKQYIAQHQQGPSQKWGNFYYFSMQNISDIYFIRGFGTVAWVNVSEYEALRPDKIAVDGGDQNLKELNAIFSKPIKELLSLETEVDDATLISIDSKGIDVRVHQGARFNIQRLAFEEGQGVETL